MSDESACHLLERPSDGIKNLLLKAAIISLEAALDDLEEYGKSWKPRGSINEAIRLMRQVDQELGS